MTTDEIRILAKALLGVALLRVGDGWTQQAPARDGNGQPVPPTDARARSWSSTGALAFAAETVVPKHTHKAHIERAYALATATNELAYQAVLYSDYDRDGTWHVMRATERLIDWNDAPERTAEEVERAMRHAREHLRYITTAQAA